MSYKIFILLISTTFLKIEASTSEKLNDWFNDQNYVNTTRPGIYEGQSARYVTFGGFSTRTAITQPFEIIDLQTPKFSAGCGGIDFYGGGFSAIDTEKFIEALRAVGQSAKSLAFMLAIQVVSPQLAGVMQKIQEWANEFKKLSKDSCAIATQMLGGTMDYFGAREGNCTIKRMQEYGDDWNQANYACTNGGQLKATEANNDGPNKMTFIKGNLAWFVLMQDSYFSSDLEFAEIIMNITGTLLINDTAGSDNSSNIITIDSAINNNITKERFENIMNALLKGNSSTGKFLIYRCENLTSGPDGCSKLTKDIKEVYPSWEGLYTKINKLVENIVAKIYRDEVLSDQEKGLINATSLPLYRFLTVLTAYYPNGTLRSSLYEEYTQMIAFDILLRSLSTAVARVDQQTSMLKNGMSSSLKILEYKEKLQAVLTGLATLSKENRLNAEKSLEMLQRIQMYEKTLMSRLGSGFISSALWGSR